MYVEPSHKISRVARKLRNNTKTKKIYMNKYIRPMKYESVSAVCARIPTQTAGEQHCKYFPVPVGGSPYKWNKAKDQARAYRDAKLAEFFPETWGSLLEEETVDMKPIRKHQATRAIIKKATQPRGLIGVHKVGNSWVTNVQNHQGKQDRAQFSEKKLGDVPAFLSACVHRAQYVDELVVMDKKQMPCGLVKINNHLAKQKGRIKKVRAVLIRE